MIDDLRIRGTISRDFRAPTLTDLYASPTVTVAQNADLLTGASFLQTRSQGNPNLRPEVGRAWTSGAVYKPSVVPRLQSLASPHQQTIRRFPVTDAVRTTSDFAITEDDVGGVDWAPSNLATPAQAESVTVPTLLVTNTCFQLVVSAEIVLDHLASSDKTQVGIEGSDHEFLPCRPEYGDTKKRLFDYTAGWLAKPGRF